MIHAQMRRNADESVFFENVLGAASNRHVTITSLFC